MSYITDLKGMVGTRSYIVCIRGIANWANGNLMGIARNLGKIDEMLKANPEDPTTMDTPAGEKSDERLQNERNREQGLKEQMLLNERGDIFASIHQYCVECANDIASGRTMTEFDFPRTFEAYIDNMVSNTRVNENVVQQELDASPGRMREDVVELLLRAQAESAGKLAEEKAKLVSVVSGFDDSMDIDEAIGSLPRVTQHRMRSKVVDVMMYDVTRMELTRSKYPNGPLAIQLRTDGYEMTKDAIVVDTEMHKFAEHSKAKIELEINESGTPPTLQLIWPIAAHADRIERAKRDIAAKEEREKQHHKAA